MDAAWHELRSSRKVRFEPLLRPWANILTIKREKQLEIQLLIFCGDEKLLESLYLFEYIDIVDTLNGPCKEFV
jgi:hypothetical protein